MKAAAILLMIVLLVMTLGYGLMYLLMFAMSFDAPGSTTDPKGWMMRILMFMPVVAMVAALIFAFVAYNGGHYKRSVMISSSLAGLVLLGFVILMITSFVSLAGYRAQMKKEAKEAELYPKQTYLRKTDIGADTIYVFPSRIVSYRLQRFAVTNSPWSGPLGDLAEDRKTLTYNASFDTKLRMEELDQFVDETGRKFTEVYKVVNKE